jgi:hypothetical protein
VCSDRNENEIFRQPLFFGVYINIPHAIALAPGGLFGKLASAARCSGFAVLAITDGRLQFFVAEAIPFLGKIWQV